MSMKRILAHLLPLTLLCATLPVIASNNTPAKPFVGVKSLWVTRNAKNVALCADLLKFFTNKENQVAMVAQTGEIPAIGGYAG